MAKRKKKDSPPKGPPPGLGEAGRLTRRNLATRARIEHLLRADPNMSLYRVGIVLKTSPKTVYSVFKEMDPPRGKPREPREAPSLDNIPSLSLSVALVSLLEAVRRELLIAEIGEIADTARNPRVVASAVDEIRDFLDMYTIALKIVADKRAMPETPPETPPETVPESSA